MGSVSTGSHGNEYETTVLWNFSLCSILETDRPFRNFISLMTEAVSTSETSVNFY
jgi:hypothetical protein